ncbi:putative non-specific serine/threonine protein kinase [Helianthus annuus]|nr:putative non-specific serine/threonine protein kinase [Helianthus annuus]
MVMVHCIPSSIPLPRPFHSFVHSITPYQTDPKRLKNLDLGQNNLTGLIPDGFWSNLSFLEKPNLSFNKFTGPIPNYLGSLSNLEGSVDLSHNMFNESIPASLGNLIEKVYIDLTYNKLTDSSG